MSSQKVFGFFPVSYFYRNRRATALGRGFSRFWAWWASLGLPPRRQVGLEVRGRRTGRVHTVAVVIARRGDEQYLVSMLGECEWVKNVRAARGEAQIISGRRRRVRLEEVPIPARAPIIKEYVRVAPGARPHIGLDQMAMLADCERVASDFPVFRIVYEDAPSASR
jgi:hypothetical protein